MKYPALRGIAVIFKVIAYIAIASVFIGIIVGIILSVSEELSKGVPVILLSILYGFICALVCFMQSEFIRLLIDLEQNSRDIVEAIRNLRVGSPDKVK